MIVPVSVFQGAMGGIAAAMKRTGHDRALGRLSHDRAERELAKLTRFANALAAVASGKRWV